MLLVLLLGGEHLEFLEPSGIAIPEAEVVEKWRNSDQPFRIVLIQSSSYWDRHFD